MILWLNPASGISGDMLLGALIDLGAPVDAIEEAIAATGIVDWSLSPRRVHKKGISAITAGVTTGDTAQERHASELITMAERATPEPVAQLAVRTLREIARVEAAIHDADPETVHLHEIGGIDTIVDVVGVSAALHALSVDVVVCNSVALGHGTVNSAHGTLPSPAPAALALLEGARVHMIDVASETTTPTGAALLRAMGARFEPLGEVTISSIGYGAGTKDFATRPNVLQAMLCTNNAAPADGPGRSTVRRMTTLETNVDDITGEQLADVVAGALRQGASDAWIVQSVGKKGRPAAVVHVLCEIQRASALIEFLHQETGTLGVRSVPVERHELARWTGDIDVAGERIGVKFSPVGQKPEHDDVVRAAEVLGRSIREVAAEATSEAALARDRYQNGHHHDHTHPHVHDHAH